MILFIRRACSSGQSDLPRVEGGMLSCCKHQERISAQEGCCEHRASSEWAAIARHRNRGAEGLVLGSRCPGVFVLEMLPAGGLLEGREGGKLPA